MSQIPNSMSTDQKESFSEKMKKTNRPLSPHVTIYSFPLVSITSITHRFSGIAIAGGEFVCKRHSSNHFYLKLDQKNCQLLNS